MKARKKLAVILVLGLTLSVLAARSDSHRLLAFADANAPAGDAATAQQNAPAPTQEAARPQTRAERRSYQRETYGRRHHVHISKRQWLFMGAVAGTSMGIGAIAGGAHGLAIGAIVGGWSAYAVHRLWRHIR